MYTNETLKTFHSITKKGEKTTKPINRRERKPQATKPTFTCSPAITPHRPTAPQQGWPWAVRGFVQLVTCRYPVSFGAGRTTSA
ncbi:hypothetical protein E2C01_002813 [Portunus trituberculatus]|uniref:Uncharacterized protein n=1 Tax=Portunus trituberculatus TaxID=210409 RepID=A0A5B7CRQ8_PORTR|nr:hypothetical protein [Portunus trituberculatus]